MSHEEFGRNIESPTNAAFAEDAVRVVGPVHELFRERSRDLGRLRGIFLRVGHCGLPNAPNVHEGHEDLDKDKGCAGVVLVHGACIRTIWLLGLEVLDREVGKGRRHRVVAGRERILALISDRVQHREIHGRQISQNTCRLFAKISNEPSGPKTCNAFSKRGNA